MSPVVRTYQINCIFYNLRYTSQYFHLHLCKSKGSQLNQKYKLSSDNYPKFYLHIFTSTRKETNVIIMELVFMLSLLPLGVCLCIVFLIFLSVYQASPKGTLESISFGLFLIHRGNAFTNFWIFALYWLFSCQGKKVLKFVMYILFIILWYEGDPNDHV